MSSLSVRLRFLTPGHGSSTDDSCEGSCLTRADLAWSFAVEAQAYDRTHRIGQLKPVFVKRLTIENTVEQRIFELQSKKQGLADASLGEGKAQKLGKMTVEELAGLFGLHG